MTAPVATRLRLAEILDEQGITQSELARSAGLSFQAVNHLCSGRAKAVSFDTLDRIAKVLKVEPGDLLVRKGR